MATKIPIMRKKQPVLATKTKCPFCHCKVDLPPVQGLYFHCNEYGGKCKATVYTRYPTTGPGLVEHKAFNKLYTMLTDLQWDPSIEKQPKVEINRPGYLLANGYYTQNQNFVPTNWVLQRVMFMRKCK